MNNKGFELLCKVISKYESDFVMFGFSSDYLVRVLSYTKIKSVIRKRNKYILQGDFEAINKVNKYSRLHFIRGKQRAIWIKGNK